MSDVRLKLTGVLCYLQGPSASAYVTYQRSDDALRAIQTVNNIAVDGRTVKTSLGTTKYCSHFMKNQACPKADCMYLHELGKSTDAKIQYVILIDHLLPLEIPFSTALKR